MNRPSAEITFDASIIDSDLLLTADESMEFHIDRTRHQLFRESLRDNLADKELFATVYYQMNRILAGRILGPSDLTVQLFEDLCGLQALTVGQLTMFLETVALVTRFLINERSNAELASSGNAKTPLQNATNIRRAEKGTDIQNETDIVSELVSPVGINFLRLRIEPAIVKSKLDLLAKLDQSDPDHSRWFWLWEFTAATADEIARYYGTPTKEIKDRLESWAMEFGV